MYFALLPDKMKTSIGGIYIQIGILNKANRPPAKKTAWLILLLDLTTRAKDDKTPGKVQSRVKQGMQYALHYLNIKLTMLLSSRVSKRTRLKKSLLSNYEHVIIIFMFRCTQLDMPMQNYLPFPGRDMIKVGVFTLEVNAWTTPKFLGLVTVLDRIKSLEVAYIKHNRLVND